jgi:pimeloyl-ACP methyl ester carboxylesterase
VRRLLIVVACSALLTITVVLVWARQIAAAEASARFALDSDDSVVVTRDDWVVFRPRDGDPDTGMIFYPGGKAEPSAYAPLLRDLAARGFLVVLTPMPLNIALFAPERATRVMHRHSEIRRWAIAGHSLGGVVAAEYADRFRHQVAGLILWASYPADFTDLSDSQLPVLSVYGTADEQATPSEVELAAHLLPATARFVPIEGGDHWTFGHFAAGRSSASLSREEQQSIALEATAAFLAALPSSAEGH